MKKIAVIFAFALLFSFFATAVFADVVTTSPQESTAASTAPEGYEDGMVREVDISAPIAACIVAVGAFIVYGIVKLRKTERDEPWL